MRKAFWIWNIKNCEKGDPLAIAATAKAADISRVYVKVADAGYLVNFSPDRKIDLVPPVITALHALGIEVYGWHYIYGDAWDWEIKAAVKRIKEQKLDGYVLDVEMEFEKSGMADIATKIIDGIRKEAPNVKLGFSSFRFPSVHGTFPWKVFTSRCDFNLPQVYWEQAHNPTAQTNQCLSEFTKMSMQPVWPVGATYKNNGWVPTPEDITGFMNACVSLKVDEMSFFSWDECRRDLPQLWDKVKNFGAPVTPPTPPSSDRLDALDAQMKGLAADIAKVASSVETLLNTLKGKGLI